MVSNLKKAALAAAISTLAPMAALIPGGVSDAQAHGGTYVSGSFTFGSPVAVFGFSYGDPFVYGHVHYAPAPCVHGPLYYYPQHHVYAHYYPRYHYYPYAAPRYYRHGHRYYHAGPPRHVRGHAYGHARGHYYKKGYGHRRDDD